MKFLLAQAAILATVAAAPFFGHGGHHEGGHHGKPYFPNVTLSFPHVKPTGALTELPPVPTEWKHEWQEIWQEIADEWREIKDEWKQNEHHKGEGFGHHK